MSYQPFTELPENAAQQMAQRKPLTTRSHTLRPESRSSILQLQPALGNRKVGELIQAKRLPAEGRISNLQPKLAVGAADDQYEQEADHVARQVVSMPDSVAMATFQEKTQTGDDASKAAPFPLQTKPLPLAASITPLVQRQPQTADIEENKDKEDGSELLLQARLFNKSFEPPLQRLSFTGERETEPFLAKPAESLQGSFDAGDEVESRLSQGKGGGSTLPDPVLAYMEPRFGADFGHVRVHTGSDAIQMNQAIGAQAFTHGSDVYFGMGSAPSNLELTAHELTHVVQQTGVLPLQARRHEELSLKQPALPIQRTCQACEEEKGGELRRQVTSQIQRRTECRDDEETQQSVCEEIPDNTSQESAPAQEPSAPDQPAYGPPAPTSEEPEASDDQTSVDQTPTDQTPAEEQTQSSGAVTIPLKQKVNVGSYPVNVGYATLKFGIAVEVAAEIEANSKSEGENEGGEHQETSITPLGFDSGKIAMVIGQKWINRDGVNIIGWDTALTEVKLEGGVKIDKGFEVDLEGSGKLACGVELKLGLHLIKIEENWTTKGPGVEASAEIPWLPFDVDLGMNVKLKDVQVHPIVLVEIEPNYKRILGEVAKDIGEEAASEQVVEKVSEAGSALLGADAIIIGGFLLAGAGSIGGTILAFKEADEIAETHGQCDVLAAKLTEGFRIGIVGGPTPGEKEMMPGYTQGIRNFNTAVSNLKQQNPDADDATIKAAIAAQADAVTAQAQSQIMEIAKDTVWNKYASDHQDTWYHSYDFDRWAAWANIYGGDPLGDPRYTRYCPKHICSHGMR